tara:strand:+ start:136 stop:1566 length:1431 start_codon:yes stop_codon:yes gene_type:complete
MSKPNFKNIEEFTESTLEAFVKYNNFTKYIVNIGCSDGVTEDPLYNLSKIENIKGLYIDGIMTKISKCKTNVSNQIDIINAYINPENCENIFKSNNVPIDIDILKVDIDGYDLSVIKTILELGYKPKIIISEFNEKIPPPISFEVLYDEKYSWQCNHFYGFSLSSGKQLEKYNYYIHSLFDKNNILFVNKSISHLLGISSSANIEKIYKEQYVKYLNKFPWNNDVNYWIKLAQENKFEASFEINKFYSTISKQRCGNNNNNGRDRKNNEYYIHPDIRWKGKGQINMNSQFGKEIYSIASLPDVRNIIETGTWNGQGSTICLMNGIINKENSKLFSVEACSLQFEKAKIFWATKNTNNKLFLLNGTLHKNIPDFQDNSKYFVRQWYDGEKENMDKADLLNLEHIDNVDFILIDGGEYQGQGDFGVLIKKNPKYIALDDDRLYKCMDIKKQLLNNTNWKLYKENNNDRHGWSIFIRQI